MTRPLVPRLQVKTDYVAAFAVTLGPILYFLPALLNHVVLGPDDGVLFNVPLRVATAQLLLHGHLPLWNPYIFGGMPLLGSAQGGLLFPPNWFYLIFSPAVATNLMVVSTYMVTALGAYLFARRTHASIAGAVVTSIVWQAGGFLLAQISHINIVHTAALLPWVLWSIERYVANGSRIRGSVIAVFVAIQIFAGHQQTFAYSLMLTSAYAIVMSFGRMEQRKRYLTSLAFTAAGVLLAAVQILPTAELLSNSLRASASYDFFSSFSMPRSFVMTLLAPYILGGGDMRLFSAPYIGQLYYTEYVAYAGVLSIMLALIALLFDRNRQTRFWAIVVVVGFVLALGRNAPLNFYRLVYFVPIVNLFRVPARHLLEVNFAIAVLAGRGLTVLAALRNHKRIAVRVAIVACAIFVVTCAIVTVWRPSNFRLLREAPVTVLRAPELFMPILTAALSALAVWLFARKQRGATALLVGILIVDLFLWGQFSGWYTSSHRIPKEFWGVPESVALLREIGSADSGASRILTTQQPFDPATPVSSAPEERGWSLWAEPDIYMMFGIQNVAGYDGFGLERYSRLAGEMKLWGELTDPNAALRSNSREIDILNARYLVARREKDNHPQVATPTEDQTQTESILPPATEPHGDFLFAPTDLSLPNINAGKRLSFKLPAVEVDHVALLSNLSFAEQVPDDAIVARLHLKASNGRVFDFTIRAGIDTADWAYDRPDIRKLIRHKQPVIATSYDVSDAQYKYRGHTYVTSFSLPEKVLIESGVLELEAQTDWPGLFLSVFRMSLMNGDRSYALSRAFVDVESKSNERSASLSTGESADRWRLRAEGEWVQIYENSRALPRAWLTSDARVLDEKSMLQAIRTGTLPDGAKWDPLHTVLVESEPTSILMKTQNEGNVAIKNYAPNQIDLVANADANSILVLSENDYPGWRAYVDGRATEIMRVNYAQRGVIVPPGEHRISFVYRPWSVIWGLLISLMSAATLILLSRYRKVPGTAPKAAVTSAEI